MRRKLPLLGMAVFVLLSSGMVVFVEGESVMWSQTFGDGVNIYYVDGLATTVDGGYAITGTARSPSSGTSDTWLAKTDESGNKIWNQTYIGDTVESLVTTSDGGYALAGVKNSGFWLAKIDESGNMEWSKTYGGTELDLAYSVVETFDGGYAIAGYTYSFGAGNIDFWLVKTDSHGNMEWNKTYGGPERDEASSLIETSDGGYAIAGYTNSFGAGRLDFWLVKTDEYGIMEWNRTYGGDDYDYACALVEASDGGYAIAGRTYSFGAGGGDFWLVKTDERGIMEWNQTYGGENRDEANSLVATSDGGYAIAGDTRSLDYESSDVWLVKTDERGIMEWNRTYGGTELDRVADNSLVETSDGGYALAGYTTDADPDSIFTFGWLVKIDEYGNFPEYSEIEPEPRAKTGPEPQSSPCSSYQLTPINSIMWNQTYEGAWAYSLIATSDGGYALAGVKNYGFWLTKTDAYGNMEWNQTFRRTSADCAYSVVETSDGGYAMVGKTWAGFSEYDFCLVKTDEFGNVEWSRSYGGPDWDEAHSVVATSDGGYAIAGYKGDECWLIKTDANGIMEWNQTYVGIEDEHILGDVRVYSVVETSDGGYAMAGYKWSYSSRGLTGDARPPYYNEIMLVKTDEYGVIEYNRTYVDTEMDFARSLVVTSDGGYAIAGYRQFGSGPISDIDFLLVKIGASGNVEWRHTYGGSNYDYAYGLATTVDGGYAIAGDTRSLDYESSDVWLVKTDANGIMEWNQTYGGQETDNTRSLVVTSDGKYVIASFNSNCTFLFKTEGYGNVQEPEPEPSEPNESDQPEGPEEPEPQPEPEPEPQPEPEPEPEPEPQPEPQPEPEPEEPDQAPINIPEILAVTGVAAAAVLLIYLIKRRQKLKI